MTTSNILEQKSNILPQPLKAFEMEMLSPNIYVRDMTQTISFYELLGFQIIVSVPGEKVPIFVLMKSGSVNIMFQSFDSIRGELPAISRTDGGSILLYIKMKGVRNFYEKIKNTVTVLRGFEKTFYGATEFSILDINNYMLTFAEDE
ncbi:MAG TPA: VOC family protein [Chitinophagaceae bacterium]